MLSQARGASDAIVHSPVHLRRRPNAFNRPEHALHNDVVQNTHTCWWLWIRLFGNYGYFVGLLSVFVIGADETAQIIAKFVKEKLKHQWHFMSAGLWINCFFLIKIFTGKGYNSTNHDILWSQKFAFIAEEKVKLQPEIVLLE